MTLPLALALRLSEKDHILALVIFELVLSMHPYYRDILLHTGSCFCQDLQKLLFDDALSSTALCGLDFEPAFFDLGYKLFRER